MTREWGEVVARAVGRPTVPCRASRPRPTAWSPRWSRPTRALRENELFVRIVELDAELLLPYLLTRRGRSQQAIARADRGADPRGAGRREHPGRLAGRDVAGAAARGPRLRAVCAHHGRRRGLRGRPRRRARARRTPGGRSDDRAAGSAPASPSCPADVDVLVIGLGVTGAGVALDAVARGPDRARRRRPRPGFRYVALVLQARARRAALPRQRPGRRRPRECRRARHPDGGHRPHLTHALPFLIPLDDASPGVAGRRPPGRAARPATCSGRRPHLARDPPAPAPDLGDREPQLRPPLRGRRSAAAMLSLGRPARGRRPAGRRRSPAPRRASAPTSAPAPASSAPPAPAASCATSSPATTHDVSARAVVNAAGVWAGDLVDEDVRLQPEPRHPPGRCAARRCPGLRVALIAAGARRARNRFVLVLPQPDGTVYVGLTDEAVDGAVPDVPEPTRGRDRLPARRRRRRLRAAAAPRPTWSAPTPGCARCCDADGAHRRPVPPARRAHLADRRGHGGRRQAHDVPPDGRGRRRRRRRPTPASTPARARTARLPLARRRLRAGAGPARAPRRRRGWSAATAPTPGWSWPTPARSPGWPTTSCSRRRRRRPGHARRAGLRGHPRGRPRRRRPARPAYPGRPGRRRPGHSRARRAACDRARRRRASLNRGGPLPKGTLRPLPCTHARAPGGGLKRVT